MVKELSSAPVALSASKDGTVIFWSLTNKNIVSFVDIGVEITCGDLNKDENTLCLGTSTGIVMFFEVGEQYKLTLIYEFRLYEKERVSEVAFSPVSD